MRTLAIVLVLRVFAILTTQDLVLTLNLIALAVELATIGLVYMNRTAFLPTKEEAEMSMRRFARSSVKTASKCTKCGAMVEGDWILCPDCGSCLPRFCAKCNTAINENETACSTCGMVIETPVSLYNMVENLRKTVEMDGEPETRSARYARLGDGLLKIGRFDEAIEAFNTAISYTKYDRKRTNFMVKMAVVLANKGMIAEADELLSKALQIDPQDVAGANRVKTNIYQCAV